MRYCFTPAAERVLTEAAAWSIGEFSDCLEAPAVLLGLLSEPECRAAITLAGFGVDASAIRSRWPSLVRLSTRFLAWQGVSPGVNPPQGGCPVKLIAPEIAESFARIVRRLRMLGLPEELGTDHLLWGLSSVQGEVAEWLRQMGLEPTGLEAEIYRVHGLGSVSADSIEMEPLPYDPETIGGQGVQSGANDPETAMPEDNVSPTRIHATEGRPSADLPRDTASLADSSEEPASTEGPVAQGDPAWRPSDGPSPRERLLALRVIDAAANRAREGLRVVEDYVRFVLDDGSLTARLKHLRHQLASVLARFPTHERLAARDTLGDVGTQLATPAEWRRNDTASVLAANFTRLQESLRSLEEFAKILDPPASAEIEQLRYQTYTLHRAVETLRASVERLHHARLYVLIDGRATAEEFVELARAIASAGAHVIQLRDKRLDDRTLLQRARALRQITAEAGVLFIMNDRPDLAVLARADGVHVGQEELSVKDARAIVGPEALVGVSTHGIEQARQAVLEGANYLGVGPIFPSETKQFESFPGVALLRAVAAEIAAPAFAIGGIRLENLPLVLASGFRRVAVGAAIANAASPRAAVREFLNALG